MSNHFSLYATFLYLHYLWCNAIITLVGIPIRLSDDTTICNISLLTKCCGAPHPVGDFGYGENSIVRYSSRKQSKKRGTAKARD